MLDPADVCWLMDSRERTGSTSSVSRAAHRAGSARTPSKRLARGAVFAQVRPEDCLARPRISPSRYAWEGEARASRRQRSVQAIEAAD